MKLKQNNNVETEVLNNREKEFLGRKNVGRDNQI